jgi:invasion protein IalB
VKLAAPVALFAALAVAPAAAQSPSPAPQPASPRPPASVQVPSAQIEISGWRTECGYQGPAVSCELLDRVTRRSDNVVIAAVSLRMPAGAKTPTLVVQVPLGIAVQNAVRIGFENGIVQNIRLTTCTRAGCFARGEASEPLISTMQGGKLPLRIAYESLDTNGTAETITVTLGLDGFASAYDRMR